MIYLHVQCESPYNFKQPLREKNMSLQPPTSESLQSFQKKIRFHLHMPTHFTKICNMFPDCFTERAGLTVSFFAFQSQSCPKCGLQGAPSTGKGLLLALPGIFYVCWTTQAQTSCKAVRTSIAHHPEALAR